jgi:50S ribosomal subunit-associated GTPase HflX
MAMTVAEKSMAMSYILSQLLIENLEIVCLEVKNKPEFGKLHDKLMKLKGASRNAFRILEKNTEQLEELKSEIDELLGTLWD